MTRTAHVWSTTHSLAYSCGLLIHSIQWLHVKPRELQQAVAEGNIINKGNSNMLYVILFLYLVHLSNLKMRKKEIENNCSKTVLYYFISLPTSSRDKQVVITKPVLNIHPGWAQKFLSYHKVTNLVWNRVPVSVDSDFFNKKNQNWKWRVIIAAQIFQFKQLKRNLGNTFRGTRSLFLTFTGIPGNLCTIFLHLSVPGSLW